MEPLGLARGPHLCTAGCSPAPLAATMPGHLWYPTHALPPAEISPEISKCALGSKTTVFKSLCGCPSPGREDVPSQAAPAPRPSTGARWHPVCVEGTGRQQARAPKLRGSLSPSRQELLRRHGPGPRGPVPSSQPMAEAGQRPDALRTTVQGRRRSAGVAGLRRWPRADTPARAPGQFCCVLTPSATG